jgi:hypothetical protein
MLGETINGQPILRLGKIACMKHCELYFYSYGRNSMKPKPMNEEYAENIIFCGDVILLPFTGLSSLS